MGCVDGLLLWGFFLIVALEPRLKVAWPELKVKDKVKKKKKEMIEWYLRVL